MPPFDDCVQCGKCGALVPELILSNAGWECRTCNNRDREPVTEMEVPIPAPGEWIDLPGFKERGLDE